MDPKPSKSDSKIFLGMNFSLFKYRLEALWIFSSGRQIYIYSLLPNQHICFPPPKFYRQLSTLKFACTVDMCRSCPPGKPILIHLPTSTAHILTEAQHHVMLHRPGPPGNKRLHPGQLSALVQHPACHSSLPAISQE